MFNTKEWLERMEKTMMKLYKQDKYIQPVVIVLEKCDDERGYASFFIDASRYIAEEDNKDKLRSRLVRTCSEKDVEGLVFITEANIAYYMNDEDLPLDDYHFDANKEDTSMSDSDETLLRLGLSRKTEPIVMFQWETKLSNGVRIYNIEDNHTLKLRGDFNGASHDMGGRFHNIIYKPNLN